MPRSKRNKQIELAKTKKRGLEWKKRLFEEVRSCVDKYDNVFVFTVNDMRNSKMKTVREQWKHSRFFIGKNKIMAMSLGRFASEEYKPNLHKLGQQIKGQRALLFSNKPVEEVLSWFRSYTEGDYARSGNTATETVHLPAGPLTMFPHNLEPYLRELGLPTTLERGVIHLVKDHEVCNAGDTLTPQTAKILKLLGYEMAEFHITIDCAWSKDGSFMQLSENIDTSPKKNKKQKKSSLSSDIVEKSNTDEEMEVEQNDEENSDSDENEEESDNMPDIVKSTLNNIITRTSTPKGKSNDVTENGVSNLEEEGKKSTLKCNTEDKSEEIVDKNVVEKTSDKNSIEEMSENIDDKKSIEGIPENIDDKNNMEEISENVDDKNNSEEISENIDDKNNREEISENIDDKNSTEEISEKIDDKNDTEEISENIDDKNNTEEISEKINDKNNTEEMSENNSDKPSNMSKSKTPATKRGRPRVSAKTPKSTKKESISKRESLVKTPDANTSQDSPVFRELRTRSVKFSRKKK